MIDTKELRERALCLTVETASCMNQAANEIDNLRSALKEIADYADAYTGLDLEYIGKIAHEVLDGDIV